MENTITGPFGLPSWWAEDAPDGELLFIVHATIDVWSEEKAEMCYKRGYVHYHELISVDGFVLHPTKVVWLKHTARTTFTFTHLAIHDVTPGVDFDFPNNTFAEYLPD